MRLIDFAHIVSFMAGASIVGGILMAYVSYKDDLVGIAMDQARLSYVKNCQQTYRGKYADCNQLWLIMTDAPGEGGE